MDLNTVLIRQATGRLRMDHVPLDAYHGYTTKFRRTISN